MDTTISEIHENLPDGTLFVVILGSADTSTMKSLVIEYPDMIKYQALYAKSLQIL